MAKPHTNIREVLTDLAPVVASVIGGLANEGFIADKVLPRVNIAPNPNFSGNLLRYAADANFGDTAFDDVVPEGADVMKSNAGSIVAVPYYADRHARLSLHDTLLIRDLPLMGEAEQIATLENLSMATVESMKISREQRIALLFQTAANFSNTAAAALVWTDPLADIIGELDTMYQTLKAQGSRATTLIIPEPVAAAMRVAPQLLNFLPTNVDRNRMGDDTLVMFLKDKFNLGNVQIADAVRNTSAVAGTFTSGYIWAAGTLFMGSQPVTNGEAGTVGTPVRVGDAMMTPSATAGVRLQDWEAEFVEEDVQPRKGYRFSYIEDEVVFQPQLGVTLTGAAT